MTDYFEALINELIPDKSDREEYKKEIEEIDKAIKEERMLKNKYLAAGLGQVIPRFLLGRLPICVKRYGGAIKVYRECLKRGISWQELCHYDPNEYDPAGYHDLGN